MNPRALFVLALCLIGIAVWIPSLFPEAETPKIQEEPGPSSDEETPDVLFAADPSSIREILIHRAETQDVVRLEPREDGHYQLTDPLVDRAEPALIGQLLMILSRTPAREMEAAWAARTDAELGIAAPRVDLEILLEDGSLYRLALGARHAGGSQVFAARNGERILAPRALAEMLTRPATQWRDHSILSFPRQVIELAWSPPQGVGFRIRKSGRNWELVEPIQGLVDPIRGRGLDRMIGMRASSLPTDASSDELRAQLEGAGGELRITSLVDGDRKVEQVLRLFEGMAYDRDRAYLLPTYEDDLAVLSYPAQELRSRRLLGFDPTHISSLRLTRPEGTVELRRGSLGWARSDGEVLPSPAQKLLTRTLVEIANLESVQEAERPAGVSARQLVLSISARVTERGSTVFRWWPSAEGSVGAEGSSTQAYAIATDFDALFEEILSASD
ncbi:MAG: hypothetical protein CMJ94_02340 [Planctomycetes bacterium]|nr:hypothetical protein [Planctomycetota bacterium]